MAEICEEKSIQKIELYPHFMSERKTAHAYLKEQFGFPEYYGYNLDAFYDCLTDLGACIVVWMKDEKEVPAYALKVLRELKEATVKNPNIELLVQQ